MGSRDAGSPTGCPAIDRDPGLGVRRRTGRGVSWRVGRRGGRNGSAAAGAVRRPRYVAAALGVVVALWATPTDAEARQGKNPEPVSPGLHSPLQRTLYTIRPDPRAADEGAPVYRAQNPAQRLRAEFTRSDFRVEGEARPGGDWAWGSRLVSVGYGSQQRPVPAATLVAHGSRIEYRRGTLVEWYVNEPGGIEQGFTLPEPPGVSEDGAALTLELALLGDLVPRVVREGHELAFAHPNGETLLRYGELVALDANGRRLPVRMDVVRTDTSVAPRLRLTVADAEATYPLIIDPMVAREKSDPDRPYAQTNANDRFGSAMAIWRDVVVVGAPGTEYDLRQSHGLAFVYRWDGAEWRQAMLRPGDDGDAYAHFGSSVAISGDVALVGAWGQDNSRGKAYVFRRTAGTWWNWELEQELAATQPEINDGFGISVAVHGDVALVGAPGDDGERGSAYVFRWDGVGAWQQEQKLLAPEGNGNFGESVAISGEVIVVSARRDNLGSGLYQGSAHVFRWDGASRWQWEQRLVAADGEGGDGFGSSVAVSGNLVVVGASGDDEDRGSAYVFRQEGSGWAQEKLVARDGQEGDRFGSAVDVFDDLLVVGAPRDDFSGQTSRGTARVFEWDGARWSEKEPLFGAGIEYAKFGSSVAVSANRIVAGEPGYRRNSFVLEVGRAYAFRVSNEFAFQSSFRPPEADRSGQAVAISQEAAVTGAPLDDVDGLFDDGSAWARRWGQGSNFASWRWQQNLPREGRQSGDHFGTAVAVSGAGEWVVVGAASFPGSATVTLLRWDGLLWRVFQRIVSPVGQATAGLFGAAVAISGNTILVSAPNEDVGTNSVQGSVYVLRWDGGSWQMEQKLTATDGAAFDRFGVSVAVHGNLALVGASGDEGDRGSAYVFRWDGSRWSQDAKFVPADGEAGDRFGSSVAIYDDLALVGVPGDDDHRGSVREFYRFGAWYPLTSYTAPDGEGEDRFGSSLACRGPYPVKWVAGAPGDDEGRGSAWVYQGNSAERKLAAWEQDVGGRFGASVGISRDWAIVGAPRTDLTATDAGMAYIYDIAAQPACSDSRDNDGDGLADMLDPDCVAGWDTWEEPRIPIVLWGPPPPNCADLADNDGDGLVDLQDPDCDSPVDPLEAPDADGDGVPDTLDLCIEEADPDQQDADGDDFGNACDADFNQDGFVGGPDFAVLLHCFNSTTGSQGPADDPACEESDMNADGFVGGPDFDLFLRGFNGPPGPSGLVEDGVVAAPASAAFARPACGLGLELCLVVPALMGVRIWRRGGGSS